MSAPLAFEMVQVEGAGPRRTAMVLHGILGSRRNWLSVARRLVEEAPGWRIAAVDLRHHGDSTGQPPPHTVMACAEDLARLCADIGDEPELLIGHSFGGKVALAYARDQAAALRTLWVLDSPPGPARPEGGADEVRRVIGILRTVPLPIAGRRELVEALTSRGLSPELSRWMTTNLERTAGGYTWRFDLDAAEEMIRSYGELDLWPVVEAPPSGVQVQLLRGARSDRWGGQDEARLAALAKRHPERVHVLPDAGHWVHSDNPEGLLALLSASFA